MSIPVHRRPLHAFLSHSSRDKAAIVDRLYDWLIEAGFDVYYDSTMLPGGASFARDLAQGINNSQALIIVLTQNAIESGWVEQELDQALVEEKATKGAFRVIPILAEEVTQVTSFLRTHSWIMMPDGELTPEFCVNLLRALYHQQSPMLIQAVQQRDIFLSATWRDENEEEYATANRVCEAFIESDFRLIGDSKDQQTFATNDDRVQNIVQSCGGLLAILPYRADADAHGFTSRYMLREVGYARAAGLSYVVVADERVLVPEDIKANAAYFAALSPAAIADQPPQLADGAAVLNREYHTPPHEQYVFFATPFDEANRRRNRMLKNLIQLITGMRCEMGDEIRGDEAPPVITDLIANAYIVIADVTGANINTSIEAGIAIGAKARGAQMSIYLLKDRNDDSRRPFMIRTRQFWEYRDEKQLLAYIHKIVYPHRRRVKNYEMA